MYSDDAPPSFTQGAMSGFNPSTATGVDYSQPPSLEDMVHGQRNSYNQFQEVTGSRGLHQTAVILDDNKAPSYPDMRHGQLNSYNQDPNIRGGFGAGDSHVSGTSTDRPLNRSDLRKVHASETSGVGGSYKEDKAPSYKDMGRGRTSDTGSSPADGFIDPDAKEFEGMSMVAKTFKKFHPNAYYKKEDDEY